MRCTQIRFAQPGVSRCFRGWLTCAVAFACVAALAGCGGSRTGGPGVPAGVRVVDVISVSAFRQQPVMATVTNRARVRRIIAWIARMRPVPPGVYSCPAILAGWPRVLLRFRPRLRGPVLATARERDAGYGSYACNPLTLQVPRRATRELLAGRFLERLQRLLGVQFGFGSGTISAVIHRAGGPPTSRPAISSAGVVMLYGEVGPHRHRVLVSTELLSRPGQTFTFTLAPGTYLLQARLPKRAPDCKPTTVTVRAGHHTHVTLPAGCSLK